MGTTRGQAVRCDRCGEPANVLSEGASWCIRHASEQVQGEWSQLDIRRRLLLPPRGARRRIPIWSGRGS